MGHIVRGISEVGHIDWRLPVGLDPGSEMLRKTFCIEIVVKRGFNVYCIFSNTRGAVGMYFTGCSFTSQIVIQYQTFGTLRSIYAFNGCPQTVGLDQ